MSSSEEWRPVPGYEGLYEVSSSGKIRSCARSISYRNRHGTTTTRIIKPKVLTMHSWGADYPGMVFVAADGGKKRRMLHQVVAEVFIPNPLGLGYINHKDSNQWNARADNLEWCTQAENMKHAHAVGRRPVGADHHFAKLHRDRSGRCLADVHVLATSVSKTQTYESDSQ